MRKFRWLVMPFLLVFLLGCGLISNIQNIKNAASTQIPEILTSAPTAQGMIETAAAQQVPSTCTGTPTAGGLGVSFDTARKVLEMTQQFAFTNGTANGQPVVTATLTSSAATTFPAIAQGFTAQFFGDVCNLSRVTVTIPRTDQQDTADQGMGILNMVLAGSLPPDVQLSFLTWVSQNYANMAVGDQQQTTIKTMQFTLQRNQTSMVLDIVPAK